MNKKLESKVYDMLEGLHNGLDEGDPVTKASLREIQDVMNRVTLNERDGYQLVRDLADALAAGDEAANLDEGISGHIKLCLAKSNKQLLISAKQWEEGKDV